VDAGCILTIDSDAHNTRELDYVRWGVSQARRAWVEPRSVLNTRSRADLLAWVAGKPARAGS
jgi:DNA polymerase (family 10)